MSDGEKNQVCILMQCANTSIPVYVRFTRENKTHGEVQEHD